MGASYDTRPVVDNMNIVASSPAAAFVTSHIRQCGFFYACIVVYL